MALNASIQGFLSCGRPCIIADGTHLKGKYNGVLFVALTKDGNEQLFPLAFGIGDVENESSWTWFFKCLKQAVGCPENLMLISDAHQGITVAWRKVYPNIPHGLCTFHIQKNLAKYGKDVVNTFYNASRCYTVAEYEKYMSCLSHDNEVVNRLMEIGPERWAFSKCPLRREVFLTSNAAESLNNSLKWARSLPVCTLMEAIRTLLCSWFVKRRELANASTESLTNNAADKLRASIKEGRTLEVETINASRFNIKTDHNQNHIVDLTTRSCSCREYDVDEIPCPHAAAAILKAKHSPTLYVARWYTTDTLRKMYELDINPLPHPDEWQVPTEVMSSVTLVPNDPRQSERPKSNRRIKSAFEASSSKRRRRTSLCTKCRKIGHYRATCTEQVPQVQTQNIEDTVMVQRRIKCGTCGFDGHNSRTCPLRDTGHV